NEYAIPFTQSGSYTVSVRHSYGKDSYTEWVNVSTYVYRVSYDVMGGAALADEFKAVGDEMDLPGTKKAGYEFGAWYLTPGGAAGGGKKYDSDVFELTGDLLLYAGYVPKQFEITLELDNGGYFTVEPGETTATYLQSFTLPVPESSDGTKAFTGWYTEANGRGTKYTDDEGASVDVWREIQGRTLVASWVEMFRYNLINNGTAYSISGTEGIFNATSVKVPAVYNGKPVTTVEGNAFMGAGKLVTVNIPDTVVNVEVGTAFLNCPRLIAVNIYDAKAEYPDDALVQSLEIGKYTSEDGVLFYDNEYQYGVEVKYFPTAKDGAYTIPSYVKSVPIGLFKSSKISELYIPSSVVSIESTAFASCGKLERIEFLPGNDEEPLVLGSKAFSSCSSLVSVKLPQRLASFPNDVFDGCAKLSYIVIDDGGKYTSKDGVLCEGTTAVYAPKGLAADTGVFTIPAGITEIGANAFAGCSKIATLVIPAYVETINDSAFENGYYIASLIFEGKAGDVGLTIGADAFNNLYRLEEVTLPGNLAELKANAFAECRELKTVTVNCGANVNLENGAFPATVVTSLSIGKDLPEVEISGVFGSNIVTVEIDSENPNYTLENSVVYNGNKTAILYYPLGGPSEYAIPETVLSIGANVFRNRTNLTKVIINKELAYIGSEAFSYCSNLTEVEFEAGRAADLVVGEMAFSHSGLQNIVFPETVTEIKDSAFAWSKLRSITLPASLVKLGEYNNSGALTSMAVFTGCANLSEIIIADGNTSFATDEHGILYLKENGVPTELVIAPKATAGDITVPDTVVKVWGEAFAENYGVTSVKFTTTSEMTVGQKVFYGCLRLNSVELSTGFKEIPKDTFAYCSSITTVTVPESVNVIHNGAFRNCTALSSVIFSGTRTGEDESLIIGTVTTSGTPRTGITTTIGANLSGEGTFSGCINLKHIDLPYGTTDIGRYAFATVQDAVQIYNDAVANGKTDYAIGLESVTIPATVKTIHMYAFQGIDTTEYHSTGDSLGGILLTPTADSEDLGDRVENIVSGLKSVTFATENGACALETIDSYAFQFTNIESVDLPASLNYLGVCVFKGTLNLSEVNIPADSALEIINEWTFFSSNIQGEITIPAGIKNIRQQAFSHNGGLTAVNFAVNGEGKTNLQNVTEKSGSGKLAITRVFYPFCNYVFAYTGIASFEFPETTAATYGVGLKVFEGCENLREVEISSALTDIGGVFAGCNGIEEIIVPEDHQNFSLKFDENDTSTIVYNKTAQGVTAIRFAYGTLDAEVVIPEGITEIGKSAFAGHSEITSVTIPATVTKIDEDAFKDCSGLASVTFAGTSLLNTIGKGVFANCANLDNVVLPNSLKAVSEEAFLNCTSLTSVTLGNQVNDLGTNAFKNAGLTAIDLPDTLTNLTKESVFEGCKDLESVTWGRVLTIGVSYFKDCVSLSDVTIPETVTLISDKAFFNTGLTAVTLPDGIKVGTTATNQTSTNSGVFNGCVNLKEVHFLGEVVELRYYTFANCVNLDTITWVDGDVTRNNVVPVAGTMGMGVFYNTGLTFITIPTGAGYQYMFNYCRKLKDVYFYDDLETINYYLFVGCSALENVNYIVKDTGEVVYNALPASLRVIYTQAFKDCVSLVNLPLPDTLVAQTSGTYNGQAIFSGAFSGCTSYGGVVVIPSDITVLPDDIFANTAITGVVIHDRVNSISATAFRGANNLTDIRISSANPYFTVDDNGIIYKDGVLSVVPASVTGKVELPSYATEIAAYAFDGNTGITEVVLPAGFTKIGNYAFRNCTSLTTVAFNEGLLSIGNRAFYGCTALKETILPETLTTAEAGAFWNTGVEKARIPGSLKEIPIFMFAECPNLTEVIIEQGVEQIGNTAFLNDTGILQIIIPESVTIITVGGGLASSVGNAQTYTPFYGWTEEQTIYFVGTEGFAPLMSEWYLNGVRAQVVYGYKG
ncbi:MAG: leucine-rich repeat protein, partial [Clostridia bacterium]|nr:leucine-rich repeat protein [Clostridia bacterium]